MYKKNVNLCDSAANSSSDAVANSSNEVNANEHLENGTRLLTPKRQGGRGRFKSLPFGAFATVIFVAVASVLIFYGCKKDQEVLQKSNAAPADLKEYEMYFPEEDIVYNKLLQITDYVNETGSVMPNMELKEAVWFLEAFFNIGVCSHQEFAMDSVIGTKQYFINVPIIKWDEEIVLEGEVLQTMYNQLLEQIIMGICGEFTINFGDMYVEDLDATGNVATLGLTILYGRKGNDYYGVQKIASPSKFPANLLCPTPELSFYPKVLDLPLRDPGMEALINQESMPFSVCIINVKKDLTPSVPIYSEKTNGMNSHLNNLYLDTWQRYGTGYRDDIYNNLQLYLNLLPSSAGTYFAPLYAFCEVHHVVTPNDQLYYGVASHAFGLEYVCDIDHFLTGINWNLQPIAHGLIYW